MNKQLVDYIRQHRNTYTREALSRELRQQGYSWEEIDAAWTTIERSEIPKPPKPSFNSKYWLTSVGFFLGVPIVIGLISRVVGLVAGLNASLNAFILLCLITLVVWVMLIITLRTKNEAIERGLRAGLIASVVLFFVPLTIIAGICLPGQAFPELNRMPTPTPRPVLTPIPITPTPSGQVIIQVITSNN